LDLRRQAARRGFRFLEKAGSAWHRPPSLFHPYLRSLKFSLPRKRPENQKRRRSVGILDWRRGRSMKQLRKFLTDDGGATAIEYALIASCISIVIFAAAQGIGTKLNSDFTNVSNGL
jgi:pilus assembly protein Flp/PilA